MPFINAMFLQPNPSIASQTINTTTNDKLNTEPSSHYADTKQVACPPTAHQYNIISPLFWCVVSVSAITCIDMPIGKQHYLQYHQSHHQQHLRHHIPTASSNNDHNSHGRQHTTTSTLLGNQQRHQYQQYQLPTNRPPPALTLCHALVVGPHTHDSNQRSSQRHRACYLHLFLTIETGES